MQVQMYKLFQIHVLQNAHITDVFSGMFNIYRWIYRSCASPSKALYIYFLKHCTLTNKAVEIIWRDLSKPSHDIDHRPLRLLVVTSLVLGPELTSTWVEHSLLWRMSLYIFDIQFLSPYMCVL